MTARLANAKEISVDATVAAILPELDGISFALIEQQRMTLKSSLDGTDIFALLQKTLVKHMVHRGLPQDVDKLPLPSLAPKGRLDLSPAGSTGKNLICLF